MGQGPHAAAHEGRCQTAQASDSEEATNNTGGNTNTNPNPTHQTGNHTSRHPTPQNTPTTHPEEHALWPGCCGDR